MESCWSSTISWMASLCDSSVRNRLVIRNISSSYGLRTSKPSSYFVIFFHYTLLSCLLRPEPHILLFRRPLGTDPQTGRVDPELLKVAKEEYKAQPGLLRN